MVLEGKHNRIVILSTQTQQHFFIYKSIRKPGPSPPSSLGRIFYHYPFIVKFFILHLPYIICTKIMRKSLKSENSFLMCHFHDYKKNFISKNRFRKRLISIARFANQTQCHISYQQHNNIFLLRQSKAKPKFLPFVAMAMRQCERPHVKKIVLLRKAWYVKSTVIVSSAAFVDAR